MSHIGIIALALSYVLCGVICVAFLIRLTDDGLKDEPALAFLFAFAWPMFVVVFAFSVVARELVGAAAFIERVTRRKPK